MSSTSQKDEEKNIYFIHNGSFIFQGFNQQLQPFGISSDNRVVTTLTNIRKRGGNNGPKKSSVTPGKHDLLTKFLNLKSSINNENRAKISIEDRKNMKIHNNLES